MVLKLLEDHEDDIDTLSLGLSDIQHLLQFVLNNSYCRFGENVYQQRIGVVIGNRLPSLFVILSYMIWKVHVDSWPIHLRHPPCCVQTTSLESGNMG